MVNSLLAAVTVIFLVTSCVLGCDVTAASGGWPVEGNCTVDGGVAVGFVMVIVPGCNCSPPLVEGEKEYGFSSGWLSWVHVQETAVTISAIKTAAEHKRITRACILKIISTPNCILIENAEKQTACYKTVCTNAVANTLRKI